MTSIKASEAKLSALLSLPKELKIEIASKGLGYFDLLRLGATCKEFTELIKLSAFDSKLFRGPPPKTLPKGTKITLHPVLEAVHSFVISRPKEATIVSKNWRREWLLVNRAAFFENAFEPPAKTLCISESLLKNGDDGYFKALEGQSITVKQVVGGCCAMWNRECEDTGESIYAVLAEIGFERFSWTGWCEPEVKKDGIVLLTAGGYDS